MARNIFGNYFGDFDDIAISYFISCYNRGFHFAQYLYEKDNDEKNGCRRREWNEDCLVMVVAVVLVLTIVR